MFLGPICPLVDSENIYHYIVEGRSSISAINQYYFEIFSGLNRADKFLSYISYGTVKEKVFYYLIDIELILNWSIANESGDIALSTYYSNLLMDEQYHYDTIKSNYSDTYNFLMSLQDRLHNMKKYS